MSTFVDTNVLVYAHDVDAGEKHTAAGAVLRQLWEKHEGVLSTQVLQEFYVSITRKIPKPLRRKDARDLIHTYSAWRVIAIETGDVLVASEFEDRYRLSFWDALIVVTALRSNAEVLLTEDLQQGQTIRGLRIRNPFTA